MSVLFPQRYIRCSRKVQEPRVHCNYIFHLTCWFAVSAVAHLYGSLHVCFFHPLHIPFHAGSPYYCLLKRANTRQVSDFFKGNRGLSLDLQARFSSTKCPRTHYASLLSLHIDSLQVQRALARPTLSLTVAQKGSQECKSLGRLRRSTLRKSVRILLGS